MQVFDTHRLSYKSAKLRAWSNMAKTTPVTFYDITDPGANTETTIGTEVVTDSAGYLFYANGTTKVNCLVVHDPCIIEVSLDGGTSWLIQWITQGDIVVPLTPDDIYALSYYDNQHNQAYYNPVLGPSNLPDYLRRDEFNPGIWAEGEIDVDGNYFEINEWTHSIKIQAGADAAISVAGTLRAGQIITIIAGRSATLTLTDVGGQTRSIISNHTYLWWWGNLFTDISHTSVAEIEAVISNSTLFNKRKPDRTEVTTLAPAPQGSYMYNIVLDSIDLDVTEILKITVPAEAPDSNHVFDYRIILPKDLAGYRMRLEVTFTFDADPSSQADVKLWIGTAAFPQKYLLARANGTATRTWNAWPLRDTMVLYSGEIDYIDVTKDTTNV